MNIITITIDYALHLEIFDAIKFIIFSCGQTTGQSIVSSTDQAIWIAIVNRTGILPLINRDVPDIMVNITQELLTSYSLHKPNATFLVAHGYSGIISVKKKLYV